MSIGKVRSALYRSAKALGDWQAGARAIETGSLTPILKRFGRRLLGSLLQPLISGIFRPTRRRRRR